MSPVVIAVSPTDPKVWTISGFTTPQELQAAIKALQVSNLPAGFDGTISGSLAVQYTDTPTDTEETGADNTYSDSQSFSVAITPVVSTPSLQSSLDSDPLVIKEDGTESFTLTAQSGATDVVTSVTIGGLQTGATYVINGTPVPGSDGSHTVTFAGTQTSETVTITVTPPANSDVDLGTITAFATAKDADHKGAGDPGQNSATVSVPVVVDAILDDALNLGDATSTFTGTEVLTTSHYGLGLTASVIHPFTGSGAGGADTDGSELRTAVVTLSAALPAGAVLNFGSIVAPVTIAVGTDPTVWTLSGFTSVEELKVAIEALRVSNLPAGFDGNISGSLRVTFAEAAPFSAAEPDVSDNAAEDTQDFSITVAPAVAAPTITSSLNGEPLAIKEDGTGTITFTANVGPDTDDVLTGAEVSGLRNGVTYSITGYLGGAAFVSDGSNVLLALSGTSAAINVQVFGPEDSDADLGTISVVVTAADSGSPDVKSSSTATVDVIVDAVLDDALDLGSDSTVNASESTESSSHSLGLTATAIHPFPGSGPGFGDADTDGSETGTAVITLTAALPGTAVLSFGSVVTSVTIAAGADPKVWTLSNFTSVEQLEAAIDALQVSNLPANFDGTISGSLKVAYTDTPTEAGDYAADNTYEAIQAFEVNITPVAAPPTVTSDITGGELVIKEDNSRTVTFSASAATGTDDILTSATVTGLQTDARYVINGVSHTGVSSVDITLAGTASATIVIEVFPPEDSDADLGTISVAVTATDPGHPAVTNSASASVAVIVDAVLDRYANVSQSDAASANEAVGDQTVPLNLGLSFFNTTAGTPDSNFASPSDEPNDTTDEDTDSSEIVAVSITVTSGTATLALDSGFALANPTVTLSLQSGTTWVLNGINHDNVAAAVEAVRAIVPGNVDGTISGTITAISTDTALGGVEKSEADNSVTITSNWTLNVIANTSPTGDAKTATVDDEGLPHGRIGGGIDDAPTDFSYASGKLTGWGGEGTLHFAFAGGTKTIGTETVITTWNSTTSQLTGVISGGARNGQTLFVATLDQDTGDYTFALRLPVRHAQGAGENDETLVLNYVVSDSDDFTGDDGIGTLTITLDDDAPVAFTAQPMIIENGANAIGSGQLNFYESIGADGGSVVFTAIDGSPLLSGGQPVTSGGKPIQLYKSDGGTTLTGKIDVDENSSFETTVFVVKLAPNTSDETIDTYTVQMLRAIDDGSGRSITSSNFNTTSSQEFKVADDTSAANKDILVTAVGSSQNRVNGSGNPVSLGASNTDVGAGELLRFDFAVGVSVGNGGGSNGLNNATLAHYDGQGFTFTAKTSGTSSILIRTYNADSNTTLTDDPQVLISQIYKNGLPITLGTPHPDGGYVISVSNGDQISVFSALGYNRIETIYSSGSAFEISNVGVQTFTSGVEKQLSFGILATDADGDTAAGTIAITTTPLANTLIGTEGGDLIVAGAGGQTINGLGGDDVLIGGTSADTLVGGDNDALGDTASYQNSVVGVTVNLTSGGAQSGGDAAGDVLSGIENVTGSGAADSLTGDSGSNILIGLDGNDTLNGLGGNDFLTGGDGDDVLIGGTGIDEMTGGAGKDTFVIDVESLLTGFDDVIVDFAPTGAGDVLDLSDLLPGVTTGTDLATGGYVKLDSNGTDTTVFIDSNGGGNGYEQVAVLKSIGTSVDITILLDDGTTTVTTI